mmetsp:Transcript_79294/g.116214  ORF Transcript_79294/g.116214 Transcript_79294/m.116214 type:complete len:283 (+) Transcript_79294:995-1843(+)
MLVRHDRVEGRLFAIHFAPCLGKRGKKQPLLRVGTWLAVKESTVGKFDATCIRDILAESQLAIDLLIHHLVCAEQRRNTARALFEPRHSGRLPPVLHLTPSVVTAPIVVEPVRHFVAQNGAHGPIVLRVRVGVIKEGCLKNTGGNPETIGFGTVEGVDFERRAASPCAPLRLACELGESALHRDTRCNLAVAEVVWAQLAVERVRALGPVDIVALVGGDANLEEHLRELVLCVVAILGCHPTGIRDGLEKFRADVAEHVEGSLPVIVMEQLIRVELGRRPRN